MLLTVDRQWNFPKVWDAQDRAIEVDFYEKGIMKPSRAAADESLMLMRLRGPHTADDAARDCRVERWVAGLVKQ